MLLSDPASRRQPLHLTRPSPPSGWPEDLHLQTAEHAQHTTKPLARRPTRALAVARRIVWSQRKEISVTTLIQRMREELVRRNYAATTIQSYLKAVEHFQEHIKAPLDQLGPDDIRSYHAHLLENRKLAVNTVVVNVCALRFLYIKVLKRRDMKEDLPYPKQRQQLPVILSPGEVAQLIGAASNLYHRTILMTLYSTGVRRAELCRLKVSDIDSKRMMVRVVQGKGGIDREIPLSKKLLAALREYYRWMRPETYLFPGTVNHSRADKPITTKVVWQAVREACTRAGIKKRVSPYH